MSEDPPPLSPSARQVEVAFARGQAALHQANRPEALRWLDRAHRLAPRDATIALVLASASIGSGNQRAAALFSEVLASADVRDGWLGLATARYLMGDLAAARAALAHVLSCFALRPEVSALADQVARATGAPGWCGLTGNGVIVARAMGAGPLAIKLGGRPVETAMTGAANGWPPDGMSPNGRPNSIEAALPAAWPRAREATVMAAAHHFLGSPISPQAIGRVEGFVEVWAGGLRGWAWCPGDPDADPVLSVRTGGTRLAIVAKAAAEGISGLAPLARPRGFTVPWDGLPAGDAPIRVLGRGGRNLKGSPLTRRPENAIAAGAHAEPIASGPSGPGGISKAGAGGAVPAGMAPRGTIRRPKDLARWRADGRASVILITHGDGGGVERRIQAAIAAHEENGRKAIVLRPSGLPHTAVAVTAHGLPDLHFELPREQAALLRLLRAARPVAAELHHFLNHDPSIFLVLRLAGVPYDTHIHDYAWFCPRIALVGRGDRYCGEPAATVCETCVARMGSYLHEAIGVAALRQRSRDVFAGARRIVAPSDDAAARIARHFPGVLPVVSPHEDEAGLEEPRSVPLVSGTVTVCVAGAIGLHKGYDVLLACARDARRRRLDLTFVVAGTTTDDERLMATGRVFVTGPYQPEEAVALIRSQQAHLALLPSIWPETWCLGLTELWRAGLRVAAFDTGAPAERIRRTGRGFLLPLGLPAPEVNDALLNAARGRSLLPIRRSSAYKPLPLMQP